MAKIPKKELFELIKRAQNGDDGAMEELIERNKGLVLKVVGKYRNLENDMEDLVQIGNMGLVRAIKKFDTSYDVEFSTYAFPSIQGEVMRYFRDNYSVLRVSRETRKQASIANRKKMEYEEQFGRVPSSKELAEIVGITERELDSLLLSRESVVSLDDVIYDGNNQHPVTRLQSIPDNKDWDREEEGHIMNIELRKALEELGDNEKQIIKLRYYRGLPQAQIGNMLGITQVQVSRVEKRILGALRNKLKVSGF